MDHDSLPSLLIILLALVGLALILAWIRAAGRTRRAGRVVRHGEKVLNATVRAASERAERRENEKQQLWKTLTPREKDVAKLAARGLQNSEIGQKLFISKRTAGTHLNNIYSKLDVHSKAELANLLRELRIDLD